MKLIELIKKQGYSVLQVAKAIGISKEALYTWSRGTRKPRTKDVVEKLCTFIGVEPSVVENTLQVPFKVEEDKELQELLGKEEEKANDQA